MSDTLTRQKNLYHSTESAQEHRLDGVRLASFGQRLLGYTVDLLIAVILWFPAEWSYRWYFLHERVINIKFDFHETGNIVVMLLYWGLGTYFSNGRTLGKWVARTRVVSLTSDRMGLWQSFERALGYGAAILEGGLGFAQVFWAHNRMCAQDRLAETIVVDTRKHKAKSASA